MAYSGMQLKVGVLQISKYEVEHFEQRPFINGQRVRGKRKQTRKLYKKYNHVNENKPRYKSFAIFKVDQ